MAGHRENARDQALLLFDGDCGFCTSCVRWLDTNLPAPPPSAPWQWTDLEPHGLSPEEASERVWLLTPDHHYGGHLAVAEILRRQPAYGWRLLGTLLRTPGFSLLAGTAYALIARYRHHLPRGTPACRMRPAP